MDGSIMIEFLYPYFDLFSLYLEKSFDKLVFEFGILD